MSSLRASTAFRTPGHRSLIASLVAASLVMGCEPTATDPLVEPDLRVRIVEPSLSISSFLGDSMEVHLLLHDTLLSAPAGGFALDLVSRDSACVSVPAVASIEAGVSTAFIRVNYGGAAAVPCGAYVVLAGNDSTGGDSVFVAASNAPRIVFADTLLLAQGLQYTLSGSLQSANAPDATLRQPLLHFRSLDTMIVRVADDFALPPYAGVERSGSVNNAGGAVDITVHALAGTAGQTGRVVATGVGFQPDTFVVRVLPVSVRLHIQYQAFHIPLAGPAPTEAVIATVGTDTSRTSTPSIRADYVRAGGGPMSVSFVNTTAAVADLRVGSSGATGDSITISLPELESSTGYEGEDAAFFRPSAAGTSRVRARVTGQTAGAAETADLTITVESAPPPPVGPFKLEAGSTRRIGRGMQSRFGLIRPAIGADSSLRITLRADRADRITLGRTLNEEGLDSIQVDLAALQTDSAFYVSAFEGTTNDTTMVYATAPGYLPDTVRIIRSGRTALLEPVAELLRTAPHADARVGVRSTDAGNGEDRLRPAGPGLDVTVSTNNVTIGRLATATDTGAVVTVHIPAGERFAPMNTVVFDPLNVGTAQLTAVAPNVAAAMVFVHVRQPTIYVQNWIAITNQVQHRTVTLTEPNIGSTVVFLRSADPAMLRFSQSGGPITDTLTVVIAEGATSAPFTLHGQPNSYGTTSVFATSTVANPDTATMQVRTAGIEFIALDTLLGEQGPQEPIELRRGFLTADSSRVELPALVLNGAPAVVATVTSSAPTVVGIKQGDAGAPGATGTANFAEEATTVLFVWPTGLLMKPFVDGTATLTVMAPGWVTATRTGVRAVVVYP